jgi:predicted  nucleic acid-binding Zn-ribbon protein
VSFFTERQRKLILDAIKSEQGEVMAEFDNEMLKRQLDGLLTLAGIQSQEVAKLQLAIEGLTDIVKADAQRMMNYETRLQSLESELRFLRDRTNRDESESDT